MSWSSVKDEEIQDSAKEGVNSRGQPTISEKKNYETEDKLFRRGRLPGPPPSSTM